MLVCCNLIMSLILQVFVHVILAFGSLAVCWHSEPIAHAGPKLNITLKSVVFDIGDVLLRLNNDEWRGRMAALVGKLDQRLSMIRLPMRLGARSR